ncbi:MAG: hypothetical protein HOQ12_00535 [Gemmatimonadaceae bacterium]|nr:hypothetical protein [Gemmatimonadaceae bacterium]
MQLTPAYRITGYAPYSVDPTETTPLTPYTPVSGGAVHSDSFKVSTVKLAGWKEYLDLPDGRHGKLDPLTRNIDKGQFTFRLLDKTLTTGSNLTRWLTAFVGDGNGAGLLNGRKVYCEESLDFNPATGVGTWSAFATGRITSLALDRGRQWYTLQVQDMSTDLDDRLFLTPPHPSATTAQAPQLLPVGLRIPWGPVAASPVLTGTYDGTIGFVGGSGDEGVGGTPIGQVTFGTAENRFYRTRLKDTKWLLTSNRFVATLTWNSGANTGRFQGAVYGGRASQANNYAGTTYSYQTTLVLVQLDPSAPGYSAFPPNGTAVTIRVEPTAWEVSPSMPVLVSDTHPVTMLRWLADGYFGDLKVNGAPRRPIPRYNPTGTAGDPFYDLEQDASFGTGRWAFTESKSRREIMVAICREYGLAIDLNGAGQLTITDVRSQSAAITGTLPAITNADTIATDPPRWSHTREGSVSRIDCTYYGDHVRPLTDLDYWPSSEYDVSPTLLELDTDGRIVEELNLSERALDANGKPVQIDCTSFRGLVPSEISAPNNGSTSDQSDREKQLRAAIIELQEEQRRLFGTGPMTAVIPCRRTSVVASIRPGNYATVTVDELPDPTTNRRGGTRLMLCTAREERGLVTTLSFLDCGRNAVSTAPTLSAALNATDGAHAIDVTLTVTTAGAVVDYCVTSTSVAVRPGDSDARWTRGTRRETNGTSTIAFLPGGRRVWLRASTRPLASNGFQRPSAYTYLGDTGYLDLAGITGPTAGAPSSITKSTAHLAWTNANTSDPVDVFLIQSGSAPADWTEAYRIATLPAGSTQLDIGNLTAAVGSSYTWLARCRDASGGLSTGTGTTFVSTATVVTAPTPTALVVAGGDSGTTQSLGDSTLPDARAGLVHRWGVMLLSTPVDPAFDREIERAPDSGGAPGTYARIATLKGWTANHFDPLPSTGATYWYRQRCVGQGADPSGYSAAVSAKPSRLTGSLMVPERARQLSTLAASDATLQPNVAAQRDTGSPTATFLTKGLRKGTCRHGDVVNFSPAFAGTPVVWFAEVRRDQTAAKWGSVTAVGNGTAAGARLAGVDVYPLKAADGLGPGSFTARLLLMQKGTPTARNFDGSGVAITSAGGTDTSATLTTAPSASDQYTVRFKGSITAKTNIVGLICRLDVVVAIERDLGGGSFVEVWRSPSPYSVADSSGTTQTYNIDEPPTVSVSSMTTSGKFRVKVISATVSGTGVTSLSVRMKVNASDGAYGVTFYTATNQYASATPDADDSVEWYAMEGS